MSRAGPRRVNPFLRLWPAALAVMAAGVAYAILPDVLRTGPRPLLPILLALILAALAGTRFRGHEQISAWLGRATTALVTLALVASVSLLVKALPSHSLTGHQLLLIAVLLWSTNVVVFALWYWEIDGGGPHARHPATYRWPDFSFPQFQLDPANASSEWMPDFIDYLFLAFNTATAFGPTDTMIMSKRAKALMMAQSSISLVILAVIAARAISLF